MCARFVSLSGHCGGTCDWSAASAAETIHLEFPAGQACKDFALGLDITPNPHRVSRNFLNAEGNHVRISAGRGMSCSSPTWMQMTRLSLTGNGSELKTIINPTDGTSTNQATGHNVIILFPN